MEIRCGTCGELEYPKWISVKDRLPKNRQIVLAASIHEMHVCRYDANVNNYLFILNDTNLQIRNVTHWMDLPNFPK